MKRVLILTIYILCFISMLNAQSVRDVFLKMPASITPAITMVNKEDMLDFKASGMKAVVTDSFDGKVEMTELSDTYISIKTSSAGNLQIKLLPLNDSVNVVCLVRTVCPDACMSNVSFYSSEWKKQPVERFFKFPSLSEFLVNDSQELLDTISHTSLSDINLFEYKLSPSENSITIESTVRKYASKEENEYFNGKLSDKPVVMVWKNGCFELE